MIDWFNIHGLKIIIIVVVGGAGYFIFQKVVPRLINRTIAMQMKDKPPIEIRKRSQTITKVINNTVGLLIGLLVLFTILAEIGINIGPALASLGILGLAVGFGAQSLVRDIINGLFILVENQYSVGDVVKVAGIAGLVEEVNLRRTILRDLDGVVHYVSNSEILIASNFTKEYSRVNINITVDYRAKLDQVIKVINRVGSEIAKEAAWKPKIIKAPQFLRVDGFSESGIEIKILGDTQPSAQWEVMGELLKRIKNEFDKEGIELSWPHRKVFFSTPPKKKK